jgi:drug/metabolite transporter (DMT)-like permease
LLHDTLTPVRLLGGALILAAVIVLTRGEIAAPLPAVVEFPNH